MTDKLMMLCDEHWSRSDWPAGGNGECHVCKLEKYKKAVEDAMKEMDNKGLITFLNFKTILKRHLSALEEDKT